MQASMSWPETKLELVLPRQHIDGEHDGQHQGHEHGDDVPRHRHQLGGRPGHAGQHAVEQLPQIVVQAVQVQVDALPVQIGRRLVEEGLQIADISPQTGGQQPDALPHLGQHEGEQGHDHRDQGQIGGEHRQGPPQLLPPGAQIALIVAAEEAARLVR